LSRNPRKASCFSPLWPPLAADWSMLDGKDGYKLEPLKK
jgi:hypothetical protein